MTSVSSSALQRHSSVDLDRSVCSCLALPRTSMDAATTTTTATSASSSSTSNATEQAHLNGGDTSAEAPGTTTTTTTEELAPEEAIDRSGAMLGLVDSEVELELGSLAEIEKSAELDPELYQSIFEILPSDDALDQPNFNPVDYLNQLFPNGP